jgi:hypothetical protein
MLEGGRQIAIVRDINLKLGSPTWTSAYGLVYMTGITWVVVHEACDLIFRPTAADRVRPSCD